MFIHGRAPPAPFFGKHSLNKQPIRPAIAKAAQSFNKSPGKIRTTRPGLPLNPMKAISEDNCEHVLMHMHEKGFFSERPTLHAYVID